MTANANDTLKIPDPLKEEQSQGIFSLSRGSIDISKGEGDNTGVTLISHVSIIEIIINCF